jgi:hypothetical protein
MTHNERTECIIENLTRALDFVRDDLAEHGDSDPDMRADEVCIEVALTRYQKRQKNARELALRAFNNKHPQPMAGKQ